jgi:hypothetical protein
MKHWIYTLMLFASPLAEATDPSLLKAICFDRIRRVEF